jgi:hypothetical protein
MKIFNLSIISFLIIFNVSCSKNNKKSKVNRIEIINIVKKCSGISSFPIPNKEILVEEKGNMFARSFLIVMIISNRERESWLKSLNLLKDIEPKTYNDGVLEYLLKPENGAIRVELTSYPKENKVTLRVSLN